jgi:hypothetical protein
MVSVRFENTTRILVAMGPQMRCGSVRFSGRSVNHNIKPDPLGSQSKVRSEKEDARLEPRGCRYAAGFNLQSVNFAGTQVTGCALNRYFSGVF